MVKTGGKIDIAVMRNIDGAKGANAVGKDRDDDAGRHKGNPPAPAFETQIGNQRTQRHHSDKEFYARTSLCHAKQCSRCGNINSLYVRRDSRQSQQPHAHFGRDRLQRGDKLFAKGNEEETVE